MKQYLDLVREVLAKGTRKPNRTGVDTISTFNHNCEIDLRQGFPLLTTKEISWKNIVVENLWFLSGETHIGLLKKHGCKFWDPWADEEGQVPSAYGNFWRHFPVHAAGHPGLPGPVEGTGQAAGGGAPRADFNDQVAWVLGELKRNPMSRRLVVSAWAPGNAQTSKLPPCHLLFVFNVQTGEDGDPLLCLHLTQRSADVALGVPYNIAGYAFLLELFSRFTGIRAGIFGHTMIDAHVYTAKADGSMAEYDHVPGLRRQLERAPRPLPSLSIDQSIRSLDDLRPLLDA
ncbi:MAG: thymidylate synthase, partial [Polyangiaceae bacterium]